MGAIQTAAAAQIVEGGKLSERTATVIKGAWSGNTRRAYRQQWEAFVAYVGEGALPATVSTVADYLAALAESGKALSTIQQAAAAIGNAHRAAGYASPTGDAVVRMTMKGIARFAGRQPRQAGALTAAALAAIERTAAQPRPRGRGIETDSLAQQRAAIDVALCRVMADAGLRRSEAAALTWADVQRWDDGSGRVIVRRSKTDPVGLGAVVAITPAAMQALERIRGNAGQDAPVFGLSESQIHRRIKAAAQAAGLGLEFGGHSGRVGMARRMARNGASTDAIMRQGRWRSAAMVATYTRGEAAAAALPFLE